MPVSAETAGRAEGPVIDDILDPHTNPGAGPPSETVQPTVVEDAPQQGATQPGSGSTVTESEAHKPRFKEQVIGYAKEIRGKTLGNTETKEQGQRIVHGEEKFEPKKVGPKAP
ncbi:hypothetical protein PHLGIDRAFT_18876 [Phlebiopsis gigantea 11061_1 CR5-6]|uniref:Uncharacterized protein n=1 Tax=Phlebiopsis gigantea (strain 11061_1 CR5-6) TaxID=745531 RepID=A0A0C3PNZ3_PHLG1|nr:hypothetical protein PHLGIDRAFT_18876 [Phlebiopsis gigantea 11061_1 CR5-6]